MNSTRLAELLRYEWGINNFSPVNIRSLVYNNIENLTILWFPMDKQISGCCSKTKQDKIIFINSTHSIGRQNFTLAHEIYHLLYDNMDEFIVCGVNENSESERAANRFASAFLIPDSALYWFKNKNQIAEWTLKDIIKCEQYYQISHSSMLYRLKNLNWITNKQFKEFEPNIIHEADKLGYDTCLYKSSSEDQKFASIGEIIRLTEKAFEDEKITGGKRKEILLKSFRNDMI